MSKLKTPYELAIEAGAKRLAGMQGFDYNSMDDFDKRAARGQAAAVLAATIPHAIPERCEPEDNVWEEFVKRGRVEMSKGLTDALAYLRSRMTPPAKPVETPKPPAACSTCGKRENSVCSNSFHITPPADAFDVERVARAIWDNEIRWTSWAMADENTQDKYRREARAAIAAMGGGRRYAVYCKDDGARIVAFQGLPLGPTTDKTYLLEVLKATEMGDRYEVREYDEQAKGKTADQLAAEEVVIKHHCQHVSGLAEAITAAIANARKGADCGNP